MPKAEKEVPTFFALEVNTTKKYPQPSSLA
jgi:hypothetical protein